MTNDDEAADGLLNISGMGQEVADLVVGYFHTLRSGGMPADLAWSAAAQYNDMITQGGIESARTTTEQKRLEVVAMQAFMEKVKGIAHGVPYAEFEKLGRDTDPGNRSV